LTINAILQMCMYTYTKYDPPQRRNIRECLGPDPTSPRAPEGEALWHPLLLPPSSQRRLGPITPVGLARHTSQAPACAGMTVFLGRRAGQYSAPSAAGVWPSAAGLWLSSTPAWTILRMKVTGATNPSSAPSHYRAISWPN